MTNSRAITRPWSFDEENKLLACWMLGRTAAEVAIELDRTRHAIYSRVQRFYRKRGASSKQETCALVMKPYSSYRRHDVLQILLRDE